MTTLALRDSGLNNRAVIRCRNLFVLGLVSWLYQRPIESTRELARRALPQNARTCWPPTSRRSRRATTTARPPRCSPVPTSLTRRGSASGFYRNITGNSATALGFVAAACRAKRPLFLGSYPITPASDVLHELAGFKNFPVYTFQAEDEIAGDGLRDRRGLRRRDRDHHDLGPRHESQGRGGGPRGQDRTADRHHRHPARGPFDRDADQAGAGGLADGDVWAARRVADSDYRGGDARPTASIAPTRPCGSRPST